MVVFQRLIVVGSGFVAVVKATANCYGNDHGHPGWVYVDFGGTDLKSYDNANQYCAELFGTQLASIVSAEEDTAAIDLKDDCGYGDTYWTWIGAKFTDDSCGGWQWEDGSVDSGFRNWYGLEPDVCGIQKCINLLYDEWGNVLCSQGHRLGLCNYIETTTKVPTITPTLKSTATTNAPTETTLVSTKNTLMPTETRFASTDTLMLSSTNEPMLTSTDFVKLSSTADIFLPSTTEVTETSADSSLMPTLTSTDETENPTDTTLETETTETTDITETTDATVETETTDTTDVTEETDTTDVTQTSDEATALPSDLSTTNGGDDEDDSDGGGNNGELIASIVVLGLALSLLCCAGVFAFRYFYQDSSKSMRNATELRTVTSVSGTHTELPESNNTTEAVECVVVPSNGDDDAVKEGVAEVRESSLAVRFGDTPYGAEPIRVSVLAQKLAEQTEDEDTSDSLYDVMPRTDAGGDSPLVGDPAMTGGSDDTPETPEEDTHGAVAREAHGGGKQLGEALADMDAVEAFTSARASSRTSKGRAPQEVVERQRRALSAMRAAVGKAESGAHVRVASQQVEGGSQLEDVVMKLKLAASTEEQKRKAKMLDMAVESQSEKMQVEFDKLRRMPLARDRLIELLLDKADTLLRVSEADF